MPELRLGMTHSPFLQDSPQPGTGGYRLIRHTGLKAGSIRVFKLLPAHLVMIVYHAQTDGICLRMHGLQNRLGPGKIAFRTDPDNPERLPKKRRLDIIIVLTRSLADADNGFHIQVFPFSCCYFVGVIGHTITSI